jgi:hypothetical protein
MNATIRSLAEVKEYEETLTCTTAGGSCGNISSVAIDFLITQLTITPSSNSTRYKFQAIRGSNGDVIDKDRISHLGVWDIYKNYAIFNDTVVMNITNAVPNDSFTIRIKYIDNFRP